MFIYDKTALAFIQKCEGMLRDILIGIGIETRRTRFVIKSTLWPIHVVVFDDNELGHFNSTYLQIGLNRKLIYLAKDSVLKDILQHELAHYLTFIFHGNVQPHGEEFKSICRHYGFAADVAAATINIDVANESKVGDLESERIVEKVKKLLQLAQSSNVHEAELATVKANELLLRHNLDSLDKNDEPIFLERILFQRKKDAKLIAIYDILKHFIVKPVMSYGRDTICLEVSGTYTNVKLAVYVGEFLNRELDRLWEATKKEYRLVGLRAKNSFFVGVARGFESKMNQAKSNFASAEQKALVIVQKKLEVDTSLIYRRLTHSSSGARLDDTASGVGFLKGRELTIRKGVENSENKLYLT